ncbi:hypothetical protein [Streptomyces sp. NPDC058664]|uniref:hypothetical protein n=1 Tax=unclassified Streptomyces TaxID=2593676 RepID=UPI003664855B
MHAYDPFPQPGPSQIPSMRPAQDATAGTSPTPIYDALYAEYRRTFRTLPGDRSGEEDLSFRAFGTAVGTGLYGHGQGHRYGTAHTTAWPVRHSPPQQTQAALPPGPRRGL